VDVNRLTGRRVLWFLCAALTAPVIAFAGTTIYTYDALGRLKTVTAPDGSQVVYNNDPAGNRQSITTSGGAPPPPVTAPGTPSGYSPTHGLVYLSWGAATGGTPPYTYYIETCQGATCTNFTLRQTSTTTNATVTGLMYPATHRVRVRARDLSGTGTYGPYSGIFNFFTS
jgi:YD repeat-containing protein